MHIVTTPHVPGHVCYASSGLVHATSILATDAVNDAFAAMKNFFGGKIGNYEALIHKGRAQALEAIQEQAFKMGANAIVGVSFDIEMMSMAKGGFLSVSVVGTAVLCKPEESDPVL